jgi:hypothetical protein
VAKATATPPDFAGVAILTVAGAAVGNSRTICLKPGSWYESALLFTAAVGDPASGKTPALDMVARDYEQLQHKILAAYDQEVKFYQQQEKQREQIARDNKVLPKGEKKEVPPPGTEPPAPKRFLTTEATSEALHLLLKQNPRGLLMYVDELVGWVRSHGQYKGGRGNDRQLWLSTWSLKPLAVDRKAQGGTVISVPRPFVAVLGGLQSEMLNELEDRSRRNDGFIHRVLFVSPQPKPDTTWTEETVSAKSRDAWKNALLALRQLSLPADGGDDDAGALPLSTEAKELWVGFYNGLKAEQRSPELPPTLIGPYGKLISYCARFALILSQLRLVTGDAADGNVIDAESMRRAVQLVDYFKSHLRAVYSRLERTPEDDLAMRALVWIRRHGNHCTLRKLQRAGIPGIVKASVAEEVLRNLADSGCGKIVEHGKHVLTFEFDPR